MVFWCSFHRGCMNIWMHDLILYFVNLVFHRNEYIYIPNKINQVYDMYLKEFQIKLKIVDYTKTFNMAWLYNNHEKVQVVRLARILSLWFMLVSIVCNGLWIFSFLHAIVLVSIEDKAKRARALTTMLKHVDKFKRGSLCPLFTMQSYVVALHKPFEASN